MEQTRLVDKIHLNSQVNINFLKYTYTTVDWCVAATVLEVAPAADKKMLVTQIGYVTYNPATDFPQTVTVSIYDGDNWTDLISATGYAPLILGADGIDEFKIGANDIVHIRRKHRNSLLLRGVKGEKLRFSTSAKITGTDKFYAGCTVIEFE